MSERISIDQYRKILAQPAVPKRDITPPAKAPKREIPKLKKSPAKIKGAQSPKEPPTFLAAILRLMACKYPQNLRIKPEERLAIDFATALREASISGRLRCVWTHPANEIAGQRNRTAQIRYSIAKAMGLIDGTADYLFLWGTGSGALEAKVGRNGQQPNQIDFEAWCLEMKVPYETFSSVNEGLSILTNWGILKPLDPNRDQAA